jgi:hypothetical protein
MDVEVQGNTSSKFLILSLLHWLVQQLLLVEDLSAKLGRQQGSSPCKITIQF